MRLLIRIGLVLVILLALGLGAIAVLMPRIVRSDAVRARIEGAAEDALGREFRYSDLDFAWLPPSLLVLEPTVEGETAQAPPVARADQVALRVALLPLLKRTVVVDSFQIEGAQVRLVRDADGVSLPGAKPAARRPDAPPQEKPAPAGQAEAGASSAPEAGRGAPPAAGGPTGEGSPGCGSRRE